MSELVERLRGIYRIPITDGLGPAGGEEPNNPTAFVRTFQTPPIHHEAAAEIERLTAALTTARNDALEEAAVSDLDVRGCARNLLAVIAAEVSTHSKTPAFRQAVSGMRSALKGGDA